MVNFVSLSVLVSGLRLQPELLMVLLYRFTYITPVWYCIDFLPILPKLEESLKSLLDNTPLFVDEDSTLGINLLLGRCP